MRQSEINDLKKAFPFLWAQAQALLNGFDLVSKDIDVETAQLVKWYLDLRKVTTH